MIELNAIYNEDCMEGMKKMPDKSVDMILTDIPYGVVNRKDNGLRNLNKEKADIFDLDMNKMLEDFFRISRGQIIVFCGKEQFSDIYEFFANQKGTTRPIIWHKSNPSPMNGQYVYLSGVELAVWFKPKDRKVFNAHCKNTVFKYSNGSRKIHPTQKNVNLFEELITDNTNENEIVFDPFMGSGTTAIACMNTNRNFIGFELEPDYYNQATERLERHKSQLTLFIVCKKE